MKGRPLASTALLLIALALAAGGCASRERTEQATSPTEIDRTDVERWGVDCSQDLLRWPHYPRIEDGLTIYLGPLRNQTDARVDLDRVWTIVREYLRRDAKRRFRFVDGPPDREEGWRERAAAAGADAVLEGEVTADDRPAQGKRVYELTVQMVGLGRHEELPNEPVVIYGYQTPKELP